MAGKDQKLIQDFLLHCEQIAKATTVSVFETEREKTARIERARRDYAYFVSYYFPHYAQTECADFHIEEANAILRDKNDKVVEMWARGHAKSTHFDILIPMWLKIQIPRQINVMVLVGKSEDNADTLLSDLQAELQHNQRYIHDFGPQFNFGSWEEGAFVDRSGVAYFARGRGQSPRGLRHREARPDYIVVDDLDDDELVENEKRVDKLTDWVLEALLGAMDMGRGRFIMIGNLIHKEAVLAKIAARPGIRVRQVNALDKDGNPSWPQKYTREEIDKVCRTLGFRSSQKEYFNNPITEGAVFKNEWIRYKKMLPLRKYDQLIAYCDPSFKSTSKNDYKAIKLWGKAGKELHCIKAFVRQTTVKSMVQWFYDLHESLPSDVICSYYIEANFIQDTLLDDFEEEGKVRGYQLPIRPDYRKKPDKFQRIESISPLWERGFVFYNQAMKEDEDMKTGIKQTLAFQKGSRVPDDGPDADEGAINKLQESARQTVFSDLIDIKLRKRKNYY